MSLYYSLQVFVSNPPLLLLQLLLLKMLHTVAIVGDCELLVRGYIIEDDVTIATEWGGGGFCFNLSRFLCTIRRLTVDACSYFVHRAIFIAASVIFQGATKRNFPASASLP